MSILTFGGGGMAKAFDGILIPQSECDVRDLHAVVQTLEVYNPSTVILTAGVSNPGPIEHASFEEELTTNLIGAFTVAQACVWNGTECMIFIASVAGLHGKPNHSAYSASKAGVISLVQSLAHEGHNAYAISPGRVNTPMRDKDYPNDTNGSRLEPSRIWGVIEKIRWGQFDPGDNILIRKVGLTDIVEQVVEVPWRQTLNVGQPVTI